MRLRRSRKLCPNRAVTLALFVVATRASAEPTPRSPEPVRLVWTRAAEAEACPESPVIEADVTARLGSNPFRSDAPDSIDVRVTRERGEWSAVIEERPGGGAPSGSRVVTSAAPSCDSLALAVGLAVALMIRERAASEPVPPPKPAAVAPVAPPLPCDAAERDERHVGTFAQGVVAFGVLPRAALGVSVLGNVPAGEHVSFRAALTFFPEQRTEQASGDYAFGATFGELGACYDARPLGPVRFYGCAAVLLGARHVVVSDPLPLDPGARFFGAGSLGLGADMTLAKPVHLLVGVDGALSFSRHSYVVELGETTDTVFSEPPVVALLRAGIGFEL